MEDLLTYILGVFAFNVAAALGAFGIVFWTRRRELQLTPARGLAVLLFGWIAGSVIVFVFHVLFAWGGLNIREGTLEIIVSLLVLCAVMYPLFTRLCGKTDASSRHTPIA